MKYILMFLQMVPAIIEAVQKIEEFIPASGWGKEKIASIRESLSVIFKEIDSVWPAIEVFVSAMVKLANLTGVFKKPEVVEPKDEPVLKE